jgi:hypothetical protein
MHTQADLENIVIRDSPILGSLVGVHRIPTDAVRIAAFYDVAIVQSNIIELFVPSTTRLILFPFSGELCGFFAHGVKLMEMIVGAANGAFVIAGGV